MEWRNPIYWTIGCIAVLAWLVLISWSEARSRRMRERFAPGPMQKIILSPRQPWNSWLTGGLHSIAILLIFVSLAGPQFGETEQRVESRGNDLYILLDVSRSMMATDVPPSRLERAKADIASLVNRLKGERVGLIVFAGQAVIQCPLTVDYENFKRILASVDPFSAPRGGTAIGDAIRKSTEILAQTPTGKRSILLVSDGGDLESSPVEAAELAAEKNIPIYAIGLGDSKQGARIPTGELGGFVEYNGEPVWTKLEPALLEDIAARTNGRFFQVETRSMDMAALHNEFLQDNGPNSGETQSEVVKAEQFQWFLGAAILILLLSSFIPHRRRASVTSIRSLSTAEQAASVLLMVLSLSWYPNRLLADERMTLEPTEAFRRAYSAQKDGNTEEAISCYEQASRSGDTRLVSAAQFNLGKLYLDQIPSEAISGDTPVAAEDRPRLESLAALAIDSFANSLELSPGKPEARQALEATKQWIAKAKETWRWADLRDKVTKSGALLAIQELAASQAALLDESQQAKGRTQPSTYADQARRQRYLLDELEVVGQRIQQEIRGEGPPDTPEASGEQEQAWKVVEGLVVECRSTMQQSIDHWRAFSATEAEQKQFQATQSLESLWNGLASYEALLDRSLREQEALVEELQSSEPVSDDRTRGKWIQRETWNRKRTAILAEKASQLLASQGGAEGETELPLESSYWKKAVALGPQAAEAMRLAVNHFLAQEASKAEEQAIEALRLLRELVPPQDQQENSESQSESEPKKESAPKDGSSQNEDSSKKEDASKQETPKDSPNQEESSKQGKEGDKKESEQEHAPDKENPATEQDEPKKKSESKPPQTRNELTQKSDENEESPEQATPSAENGKVFISPERLEELLRKVREREVEKRIRDKRWRERIYGRKPVEKDW